MHNRCCKIRHKNAQSISSKRCRYQTQNATNQRSAQKAKYHDWFNFRHEMHDNSLSWYSRQSLSLMRLNRRQKHVQQCTNSFDVFRTSMYNSSPELFQLSSNKFLRISSIVFDYNFFSESQKKKTIIFFTLQSLWYRPFCLTDSVYIDDIYQFAGWFKGSRPMTTFTL